MEKYILFGAGNFGKSALRYYGEESILCFADNNLDKVGREFCGKKIISFEEAREKAAVYKIIITTAQAGSIKEQFEEHGIVNYRCYTPAYEHFVEYMKNKLSGQDIKSIVLYGMDCDTPQVIEALDTLGLKEMISFLVCSEYDSGDIESGEYKVSTWDEILDVEKNIDCFIVSASRNHIALHAKLKQNFRKAMVIDPYRQIAYYDTDDIIFNPYIAQTDERSEAEWNKAVSDDENKKAVRAYVDVVSREVPLFEYIEIETVNRCNGVCSFCPVNKNIDTRPAMKMEWKLFEKIIDELSKLEYKGELSLFSNNEPLLDDRIVELHRYARTKLPNARIHLFTNGTLFTLQLFVDLIPYVDELIIDNYMQDLKLIKPAQEICNYVEEHPELRRKVTIVLRKQNEILTSRGGDAPNRRELVSYSGETCALPFEQMIIRPDGKVSLCCNDPLGKNTLGDVSKDSLVDVWYGVPYQRVRESIAKGRGNWEHCKFCDTFYLY